MYFRSQTAASIKMETSLSLAAMIEPAKYGILALETSFILFKDIKMLYIAWPLMFRMAQE